MSRYTFTCEHFNYNNWNGKEEDVSSKTTTEFRAVDLTTMLENYEIFLRASGFHFDGVLDIVKDEDFGEELTNFGFSTDFEPESTVTNKKAWDWTVNELMKPIQTVKSNDVNICSTCGINKLDMRGHKCWDKKCPNPEFAANAN